MLKTMMAVCATALLACSPLLARGKDQDNDGIRDRKDHCPATQVGAKVDRTGCPVDSDRDGVPSGIDRCSRTPSGWPVDEHGCPTDIDRDGVVDAQDTCGATQAGARVDTRGCPSDADADGVLDGLDRCDGTPAGNRVDGFGCPVDGDHDGVNDAVDLCADSRPRETVDGGGCRVKTPPLFGDGRDVVKIEGLSFEKNAVEIPSGSGAILEQIAASLADWPETRVEIAAHTDRAGSASSNKVLSQRRADYVATYLAALGVDPARISAKGYGESAHLTERTVELRRIQ